MKTKLLLFLCTTVSIGTTVAMQNNPTGQTYTSPEKTLNTSPKNQTQPQPETPSYFLNVLDKEVPFLVKELPNNLSFIPVFIPIDLERNKEVVTRALQEYLKQNS